jgi:dihydropteridine reductase
MMMASSPSVPMVINLSIKAATPAVVTSRSLGCTIFATSPAAVTSRFSNNYYHQVRNFARSGRPSSSKRIRRGGTNNNSTTAAAVGGGGGNNNGIITNNPHPRHQTKNILIIGSQGELGKTLVSHFGKQMNWNVVGADVLDPSSDVVMNSLQKKGMTSYITLPMDGSIADLSVALYRGVDAYLQEEDDSSTGATLDAIVCASGGWMGDIDKYTHQQSIIENELLEDVDPDEDYIRESSIVCDRMMRVNYYPVVAGGMIGQQFLNGGSSSHNSNGLFVIIGASAALSPTPGMMGYGSAKAASHHYLQSYGPSVTEENGSTSVGILPLMLDTPANRAMLGSNDDDRYSKMVKPIHIANEIGEWIKNPHLRPHSGSLVKVIAKNRKDGSGGAAFHLVR